jgi:ketosteroid isomerase-like protein
VIARWTLDNPLATGERYTNDGVSLFRLRDGRIREYVEFYDPGAARTAFLGSPNADNVALAKRLINRSDGDWQPLLDRLADDVVFSVTIPDGTPISGEVRGKAAVKGSR